MKALAVVLWQFVRECLGESGAISFGRTASAYLIGFFTGMDAWHYHKTGHLVDNATLLTQLTVMTAFYFGNKAAAAMGGKKDDPPIP